MNDLYTIITFIVTVATTIIMFLVQLYFKERSRRKSLEREIDWLHKNFVPAPKKHTKKLKEGAKNRI